MLKNIDEIMADINVDDYEDYGKYIAKLDLKLLNDKNKNGKLILITAITPTPSGEGKTTTAIGLGNAMKKLKKNVGIAIREPSLGPCFGVKGGATGGGKSTVEPSDKINLIFTGDFPAISTAHNLLSAMINNHIFHGNKLNIDPKRVVFPRNVDMDDRSLRSIIVGNGDRNTGILMNDHYVITAASEIMAIMALSLNYKDLKNRLKNILIGYTYDGKPVFAGDLNATGAMAALLVDALKPNIVQTSENVPAIIHTGPFGNIAHGTSSIIGDYIGLKLFDYLITEAGFGSDLGFEKFMNIFTRESKLNVNAVVIVATLRALKYHGGSKNIDNADMDALKKGMDNLYRHVEIVRSFGIEPVIAINRHNKDTEDELKFVSDELNKRNIIYSTSDVYSMGGDGGIDLAKKVIENINENNIKYTYDLKDDIRTKIIKIAKNVYKAKDVKFSDDAEKTLKIINKYNFNNFYVCMAKTQSSLSDNTKLLNSPENFNVTVNMININSGSKFIVPVLGNIMTMPGLPKKPAAENIDIDDDGNIIGLS